MSNNETNKATVKVVRQQIHEINDITFKYKTLSKKYLDALNDNADFKILIIQLKGENKKLWVLLEVATKEIKDLKEKIDRFTIDSSLPEDYYGKEAKQL